MFVSPYRTSVTAAHQDSGKRADPKTEYKYRSAGYISPKRLKSSDYDCTQAARQREGKTYVGGKTLRRRMAKLGVLKANFKPNMPNAKMTKCTMPGSMNR